MNFTLRHTSIRLPLDDDFLKLCKFVDFESHSEVSFDNVQAVAQKFTVTLNNSLVDPEKFDELEEEFLTYQAMQIRKFQVMFGKRHWLDQTTIRATIVWM